MNKKRLMGRLMRFSATLSAGGSLLLLDGCDPTIQSTVENGIINVSTALLASLAQAITQVYTQDSTIWLSSALAHFLGQ
ncbi:MAG: hypothetical protein HZB38_09390 [Planctomycetes bacterium]|nr:hypothetical protein [Planctomycetota bacterium]